MLSRATTRSLLSGTSKYRYSTVNEAPNINGVALSSELDSSYQKLAEDISLSLKMHKEQLGYTKNSPKESDEIPEDSNNLIESAVDSSELLKSNQWKRKSPEARLGSNRIGQLKLPFELVSSMQLLINESDKHQLRSDAKRLMLDTTGKGSKWMGDTPKYSRGKEERIMGPREGLAYATITLPGQIAAIRAVLHEIRTRFPLDWTISNVLDFGSQTGGTFWSTLTFFGNKEKGWEHQDNSIRETSLKRYIGFDNRQGLVSLAKRIQRELNTGDCVVMQKQFWRDLDDYDIAQLGDGSQTLAISAFVLSQLPTPVSRKQIVKEMWESPAQTIIIIDQGTKAGFDAVADAREYLLRLGNRDPEGHGTHVVAPCPHDGVCPLRNTTDFCSFPQRFQRPDFLKKTKHDKMPHENVYYSYTVIRKGKRPGKPQELVDNDPLLSTHATGENASEILLENDDAVDGTSTSGLELVNPEPLSEQDRARLPNPGDSLSLETERQQFERKYKEEESDINLQDHLKRSSYHWRRIIYSPMKGSGHVTIDACTPKGTIARLVIPRSQGKQEYYDARKSSWGDLLPHEPKNGEVIRQRGIRRLSAMGATADIPEQNDPLELLASMGTEGTFGGRRTKGKAKLGKEERREAHRRRFEWRKEERLGYRA